MIEIKDRFDFVRIANTLEYTYAKTFGKTNPHEYCYYSSKSELETIRALNKFIQENGEKEMFYQTEFDVFFADGYKYWCMDKWNLTKILNRNWDFKNEDGTLNKSRTEAKKSKE